MEAKDLLGSWEMLSCKMITDGVESEPLGQRPNGFIHYLDNGQMAVIIAHEGRKIMSGGRRDSPPSEMLAAAASLDAYGGAYTFADDRVVHHVAVSSYENDKGTDAIRLVSLAANGDLLMSTPATETAAGAVSFDMVWRKIGNKIGKA